MARMRAVKLVDIPECPDCGCAMWWHDENGCQMTGPPDPTRGRYPGCRCTRPKDHA